MNLKEALAQLESMGDEKRRAFNLKPAPHGIPAPPKLKQYGVAMGDLRKIAAKIKPPTDHKLGLELWKTGNIDAQLLAILVMKPKELSAKELDTMVREAQFTQVADWLNAYVVANHPEKDSMREKWMKKTEKDGWAARAGWNLTASKINKGEAGKEADDLDVEALLDRIEKEMPKAPPETQWTINNTLMAIGIKHAAHRKRAIAIGEKIGLYKDWPMSKGCIIPYAPTAITELAKRQK